MGENQVQQGLYSQSFEHDNCGIGAVVNIKGRKDHQIVADALKIVEQLEHLSLIHISEHTRLLSISYAVFSMKKK